ncbi:MAG: transcription initiation factor IIB, partial [Candidatus Bathyarchaeia archaeon]
LSSRLQMWRLRKWQIRSRVQSSIDRNLAQAMTEIDRLSDKLAIPSAIKERAAVIYRKALEQGLVRGRSIAAIAAAALYAACRLSGTPRNLKEISEASLVGRKDIARCYRLLLRELSLAMPVTDPAIYIPKIAERANIAGHIQTLALKILNEARQKRISAGKDPVGLAAAALYIAAALAGEKRTQKEIADAANVTEVTVRNRYKTLKRQLNLEIPD